MATAVAPERKNEVNALDQERPWTLGSVWSVDFIRLKPGHNLDYGRELAATWKKMLDDQKKQGIVLSYKILTGAPSNRDDFTHMLMVEFPNYGVFDQQDKMDEAVKKSSVPSVGSTKRSESVRRSVKRSVRGSSASCG